MQLSWPGEARAKQSPSCNRTENGAEIEIEGTRGKKSDNCSICGACCQFILSECLAKFADLCATAPTPAALTHCLTVPNPVFVSA